MESNLYEQARASLGATDKNLLDRFEKALDTIGVSKVDGPQLVKNLRAEARLMRDADVPDSTAYADFLRMCVRIDASSPTSVLAGLAAACQAFEGQGAPIRRECLADVLFRYSVNRRIVSAMVERVLGVSARIAFDDGSASPAQVFADLARYWSNDTAGPDERLGTGTHVFATFNDGESAAPRHDALAMAEALALPILLSDSHREVFLYELTYATDAVSNCRYPTVADAGTIHLFEPCPDIPPHAPHPRGCYGRTRPLGGHPSQPELLHDNHSLSIVNGPPRFVGELNG
jgi:hypothetical protein